MEKEVFARMRVFAKRDLKKLSWSDIEGTMRIFNFINENDLQDGRDDKKDGGVKFKQKIATLSERLQLLGLTLPDGLKIELAKKIQDGGDGYFVKSVPHEAILNREKYLCDRVGAHLRQDDYPGTILPIES